MDDARLRVGVLIGSTREGRFADTVARWFASRLERRGDMRLMWLDLSTANLPAVLPAGPHPAVDAFAAQIAHAEAFAVITPEYNHSYPAALKQAIDLVYDGFRAKPIGFVSYGGISGGLRAVEHLRPVFAELHAVTVRDTVSFHGAKSAFDPAGHPRSQTADIAADRLLDALAWWGHSLREARARRPYPA